MNAHGRLLKHRWLLAVAVVALLAVHLAAYRIVSHLALSTTVASVIIFVIVIKHLGLLGPLYVLFRRKLR